MDNLFSEYCSDSKTTDRKTNQVKKRYSIGVLWTYFSKICYLLWKLHIFRNDPKQDNNKRNVNFPTTSDNHVWTVYLIYYFMTVPWQWAAKRFVIRSSRPPLSAEPFPDVHKSLAVIQTPLLIFAANGSQESPTHKHAIMLSRTFLVLSGCGVNMHELMFGAITRNFHGLWLETFKRDCTCCHWFMIYLFHENTLTIITTRADNDKYC